MVFLNVFLSIFFFFKDIYKGINHKTWVLVTKYGFK